VDAYRLSRYVDAYRLFGRGEPWVICSAALAKQGPLDTGELALALMRAKGMDTGDTVLAKGLTNRLIHSLRMQEHRGKVRRDAKRKGGRCGVCRSLANDYVSWRRLSFHAVANTR
jgi:hypothetical protein